MRRPGLVATFLVLTVTASVANAGWDEFWARVHLDWKRMNCWPEPFQQADRELVRGPLIQMTDNGWRVQNTLSDHLFTVEQNDLNQAGALKVRWIVTQAPPHRRTVFILRGATPEATMARVESVQQEVARIMPEGGRPSVILTDTVPAGGSGDYFDSVDRQLKQSIPAPRLAPIQSTTN